MPARLLMLYTYWCDSRNVLFAYILDESFFRKTHKWTVVFKFISYSVISLRAYEQRSDFHFSTHRWH